MNEPIVGTLRKIARLESARILTTELGVVTTLYPHAADGDQDNYQCSVRLKHRRQPDGSAFELRKVPVATPHLGLANVPNVGDLVLVTFLGGDLNAPVITGRLYDDENRPPVNQENELLLQHELEGGGRLKIDRDGVLTLGSKSEECVVTVADDGITLESGSQPVTVRNDTCTVTLESGGITLDAGSANVTIQSGGTVAVGDGTTAAVEVGGRAPANPVGDGDNVLFTTHTHVGNLGAPCPVMVGLDTMNSIEAKTRNTKVG